MEPMEIGCPVEYMMEFQLYYLASENKPIQFFLMEANILF